MTILQLMELIRFFERIFKCSHKECPFSLNHLPLCGCCHIGEWGGGTLLFISGWWQGLWCTFPGEYLFAELYLHPSEPTVVVDGLLLLLLLLLLDPRREGPIDCPWYVCLYVCYENRLGQISQF